MKTQQAPTQMTRSPRIGRWRGLMAVAMLSGLTACGGGGGGNSQNNIDTTASVLKSGVFIDGAVSGISYKTSSGVTGVTDGTGKYQYRDGDRVEFIVGGLSLGSMKAQEIASVLGLANYKQVMGLLQSIDSDGNPSNGIQVSKEISNALASPTFKVESINPDDADFSKYFKNLTGKEIFINESSDAEHAISSLQLELAKRNINLWSSYVGDRDYSMTFAKSKYDADLKARLNYYTYSSMVSPSIDYGGRSYIIGANDASLNAESLNLMSDNVFQVIGATASIISAKNALKSGVMLDKLGYVADFLVDQGVDYRASTFAKSGQIFASKWVSGMYKCAVKTAMDPKEWLDCGLYAGNEAFKIGVSAAAIFTISSNLKKGETLELVESYLEHYYLKAASNSDLLKSALRASGYSVVGNSSMDNDLSIMIDKNYKNADMAAAKEYILIAMQEVEDLREGLISTYGLNARNIVDGSLTSSYINAKFDTASVALSSSNARVCWTIKNNLRVQDLYVTYKLEDGSTGTEVYADGASIPAAQSKKFCTSVPVAANTTKGLKLTAGWGDAGAISDHLAIDVEQAAALNDVIAATSVPAFELQADADGASDVNLGLVYGENTASVRIKSADLAVLNSSSSTFSYQWVLNSVGNKSAQFLNGSDTSPVVKIKFVTVPAGKKESYFLTLKVTNTATGFERSADFWLTVDNRYASATITPSTAEPGIWTTFTVNGYGFPTTAVAQIQGADCPSAQKRWVSSTQLQLTCRHEAEAALPLIVASAPGGDSLLHTQKNVVFRTPQLTIANGFDYPIGDRGRINGVVSTLPEQIQPERNDQYVSYVTQNLDGNYVRTPTNANTSLWRNAQDVGSYLSTYGGLHPGEDWNLGSGDADANQVIYSVADGEVVAVKSAFQSGYETGGWVISIKHKISANKYIYSIYAHVTALSQTAGGLVASANDLQTEQGRILLGAVVSKGQPIARLAKGNSSVGGMTNFPSHLHFEMRSNDPGATLWAAHQTSGYYVSYPALNEIGVIDGSDFIDANRYGVDEMASMKVTSLNLQRVIKGQANTLVIRGEKLPRSLAAAVQGSPCEAVNWVSETEARLTCTIDADLAVGTELRVYVATNANGAALNGADNLSVTVGDGVLLMLSNAVVSVYEDLLVWVEQAVANASRAVFSFGQNAAPTTASQPIQNGGTNNNKVTLQYSSAGSQTVSVEIFDSSNKSLGRYTSNVLVLPSARISAVQNDNVNPSTMVPTGATTPDTTPKLTGTISAALGAGDSVRVYGGGSLLGEAPTTGTSWTFTPSALNAGTHVFKAVVYNAYSMVEGSSANTWTITVAGASTTTSKLPHSGITANQCYSAGSDVLMACSGVANDLNAQQDGHRAGINAMSYSTVGNYPITDCVKDNITGLIWEGKTASGLRAGSNGYTNYDSTTAPQKSNGSTFVNPTQADIDAPNNTVGFKNAVNASALCGYADWRLPTADELQSLVDYGVASSGPTLDATWFPNTPGNVFWAASPYAGNAVSAWVVFFTDGSVDKATRFNYFVVRLVR